MATALRVGKPFFFDPSSKTPVEQVLCGPFTGPGSEAIVVSFTAPTCWSPQGWAVFRFSDGDWRLVMVRRLVFVFPPLVAVGADIREKAPVFRQGDPRCIPSGGRKTRIWHWNGTRFEAGPWKQVTEAATASRGFRSPSGNISYGVGDTRGYRGVTCQSYEPIQRVAMDARGRLKICRGSLIRCQVRDPGDPPILRYGRRITVGRFSCLSRQNGITCTVIRLGKGFLINRDGVRRVGR
jgi:hypothetical protein